MNLLLLAESDRIEGDRFFVEGARFRHLIDVLKVEPGKRLRAGLLEGPLGAAVVSAIDERRVELVLELNADTPPRPSTDLILAVPRPKSLKKIFPEVSALGVDRLVLLRTWRVSPPYLESPLLRPDGHRPLLLDGLMQAGSTRLPNVALEPRFLPFVQDRAPSMFETSRHRLVLHPSAEPGLAALELSAPDERVVLAIGPEGGFLPYEVDRFVEAGFVAVHMGARILRVETAVVAALAQLDLLRQRAVAADERARFTRGT